MTRVLRVDPDRPDRHAIEDAARELARGRLVAFPTETVYGLGAHALDAHAVARLFQAKGRPATDPVIVHIADANLLSSLAEDIPRTAYELARRFWPGPLTLILHKRASVPDAITAGRPTVGVRVPSHAIAQALLQEADVPVAAPSANRFSQPSPTTAAHVLADLDGLIDLVVDGGPSPLGIESTIVDLTVAPHVVRRPGGVTIEAIREVIPEIETWSARQGVTVPQPAPGQFRRHYAPRSPLTLYVGEPDAITRRIAGDARAAVASGSRVGILAPEDDLRALAPRLAAVATAGRIATRPYGSRGDPMAAARNLFAALRELDQAGVDLILASAPDEHGIGAAVVDRLTRAADGRVIYV